MIRQIRALWGNNTDPASFRYKKVISDIAFVKAGKYGQDFSIYVYGENNYKLLLDEGFKDVTLMDKRDIVYDLEHRQFKHKLDILVTATGQHDEVLFLDWDTIQTKPTDQAWIEKFSEKASMQAILKIYHVRKAMWREEHQRKIPCGAYMYLRGYKTAEELIKCYNEIGGAWSEEIVMALYTDKIMGKFDADTYNKLFEPSGFTLIKSALTTNYANPILFEHFNYKQQLAIHKADIKPDWIDLKKYDGKNFVNIARGRAPK